MPWPVLPTEPPLSGRVQKPGPRVSVLKLPRVLGGLHVCHAWLRQATFAKHHVKRHTRHLVGYARLMIHCDLVGIVKSWHPRVHADKALAVWLVRIEEPAARRCLMHPIGDHARPCPPLAFRSMSCSQYCVLCLVVCRNSIPSHMFIPCVPSSRHLRQRAAAPEWQGVVQGFTGHVSRCRGMQ